MSFCLSHLTRQMRLALIVISVLLIHQFAFGQTVVLRVDGDDGLPLGDGETWPTAFEFLPDAIDEAVIRLQDPLVDTVQIWVAEWTYHVDQSAANPGGSGDRNASVTLLTDVEIYGGFLGNDGPNGGETALSERDPLANITTLSGEITLPAPDDPVSACTDPDPNAGDCFTETPGIPGCTDVSCCDIVCDLDPVCCITGWDATCVSLAEALCENAYHVVTADHTEPTSRLDGFTITGGVANGGGSNGQGGGIWFNGAGFQMGPVGVTIANCQVIDNFAINGGGLYSDGDDSTGVFPKLINCVFISNQAQNQGGGAFSTFASRIQWVHCLFSGNTAGNDGGGLFSVQGTNFDLINCTFHGNTATNGDAGGVYFDQNSNTINTIVSNGIFWANQDSGGIDTSAQIFLLGTGEFLTVRYSDIEGGPDPLWDGGNNITDDPLFVAAGTNYRLNNGSPCIDAADNDAVPCDEFDIDHNDLNCLSDPIQDTPDLDLGKRRIDDPDTDDTGNGFAPIVDMGTYEFCPPNSCPWDLDGGGFVGAGDLLLLLADWFNPYDAADLLALLADWGVCPCVEGMAPPSLADELADACLSDDDWQEFLDTLETGSSAEQENYICWLTHYFEDCTKCICIGASGCPGPDPFN